VSSLMATTRNSTIATSRRSSSTPSPPASPSHRITFAGLPRL
jgi:hypothetical protein